MGAIDLWLVGAALLLGGLVLAEHGSLARAMRPRPAPPRLDHYPSVTVVRPIKGLDVELRENVRAGLDHGYPGAVESLFVFDDEFEPGIPVVEKQIREHRDSGRPGVARMLFCGAPPPGRTGKLNAMIQGVRQAAGELIVFADSDIRTDREALRILVETLLQSERAGSSFAPVVVSEPNHSIWDAVCGMLLNGLYTPYASRTLRRTRGELPFILGQLMAMTRASLAAIGGLERAAGQIVDDLYIGQLVEAAGLRNVASSHPIRIVQYGLDTREGYHRFGRWITFSRAGIPQWSFKLPIVFRASVAWLGLAGGILAAAHGDALGALALLALPALVTLSIDRLHERTGCARLRPRHWLAPMVIIVLAPWVFFQTHVLQRRMAWRGRVYELRSDARLATRSS